MDRLDDERQNICLFRLGECNEGKVYINGEIIESVQDFVYLGKLLTG